MKNTRYLRMLLKEMRITGKLHANLLSEEIGKSFSYISQLESGGLENVPDDVIRDILKWLIPGNTGFRRQYLYNLVIEILSKDPHAWDDEWMYNALFNTKTIEASEELREYLYKMVEVKEVGEMAFDKELWTIISFDNYGDNFFSFPMNFGKTRLKDLFDIGRPTIEYSLAFYIIRSYYGWKSCINTSEKNEIAFAELTRMGYPLFPEEDKSKTVHTSDPINEDELFFDSESVFKFDQDDFTRKYETLSKSLRYATEGLWDKNEHLTAMQMDILIENLKTMPTVAMALMSIPIYKLGNKTIEQQRELIQSLIKVYKDHM